MTRIFLSRCDLRKPDVYRANRNHIQVKYERRGSTTLVDFGSRYFDVFSVKTGNLSRRIYYDIVEIENVSNLFYLLYTDSKIRSKEIVRDSSGKLVELVPIARVKLTNHLVYAISKE